MKIQRFVLRGAVALAAFGASVGLIELGNYVRTAFVSPKLKAETKRIELVREPPVYVHGEFKLPVVAAEPETTPDAPYVNEYGNNGEYYLIGKEPEGFEDFGWLSFTERDWDETLNRVVAVKPSGSINTNREFEFSRVNVTGKRIAAVTKTVKGISYQFDGKFVDEEIRLKSRNGEYFTTHVSLKGRLTKWRNGKRIAEAKVKFEMGGC